MLVLALTLHNSRPRRSTRAESLNASVPNSGCLPHTGSLGRLHPVSRLVWLVAPRFAIRSFRHPSCFLHLHPPTHPKPPFV